MIVVEDLKAAREIVRTGWCSNGMFDEFGNLCIMAALNEVAGISIHRPINVAVVETTWIRRDAAHRELKRHLPSQFGEVAEFNDHPSTTHDDALNLFDKALADLGGLAD